MPSRPPRRSSRAPRPLYEGNDEEQTRVGTIEIPVARSVRDRAYLIVLTGEGVGSMFRIEGEAVIGRSTSTTIRLNDDGISRRHARLVQTGTQVVLEDLKSANGTFVNDVQIAEQILKDGDKIRIGSTTILKFSYHDDLEESFQQRMYEAALYDSLTRAYNKKHLLERLPTELAFARRHKAPLSVLMFDVDHFKKVNDNYGHLAGDHVLARLGKITHSAIRTEDIFARYGGEEFCILSRGVDIARAAVFAERLRLLVETTDFDHDGTRVPVTISIGVSAYPEIDTENPLDLLAGADAALYTAKRGGRNRVELKR